MKNAINWFEIPALNFYRAKEFYSGLYNTKFEESSMEEFQMAFFPCDQMDGGGDAS